MIELRGVEIAAGDFRLADVQFQVNSGEYAVLMGKTGAGKSSLVEAICGLRSLVRGQIFLDHQDVTLLPPAKRNIGYVPQDLALFESMTVEAHLRFAPRIRGCKSAWIKDKVQHLAGALGIEGLLRRRIHRLSGGEAQRVALGRALSFEPKLLILDEPLTALDEGMREEMHELLRTICQQTGVTTLHITHSRSEAIALATQWLVLEQGRVKQLACPPQSEGVFR